MLNNGNGGPGRPGYDQNQQQAIIQQHMQHLQLMDQNNRSIQNHFGQFQNPPPQPQPG